MPQVIIVRVGRDYLARDQAVFAEPLNGLVMTTFEEELPVLDELTVDMPGRERMKIPEHRLTTRFASRRCRQAHSQNLRRFRITNRELTCALYVAAGVMPRCAHEAKVILPSHRRDHVLGCKIDRSVVITGANQYQWRDREKLVPAGTVVSSSTTFFGAEDSFIASPATDKSPALR